MLQITLEIIYFFELVFFLSSDRYSEVQVLDHMIGIFQYFKEHSLVAEIIYIHINCVQGFLFLCMLTVLGMCCLFNNSHLDRCEVIFNCFF